MAKTEAEKKVSKSEAEKLLDWLHTMELTWVALILSCAVGLVGLLSEIRYYGSSPGGIALTSLLVFLALIFIGAFIFGVDKIVKTSETRIALQRQLPEAMFNELKNTWSAVYELLFETKNKYRWKRWLVSLAILIFAVTWIATLVLKIYLTAM